LPTESTFTGGIDPEFDVWLDGTTYCSAMEALFRLATAKQDRDLVPAMRLSVAVRKV